MNITLIGATGFVGTALLKELTDRGHTVKAISRHPEKITLKNDLVHGENVDILDTAALATALKGQDAVISAYNPGWSNPDIYNEFIRGANSIQQATREAGVKRLIVIGGAGSLFVAPGVQLIDTPQFPEEYKPGASAARDYLDTLRKEEVLEWTFISPAIEMHPGTSGTRKGEYRTALENPVFDENNRSIISVEDLAVATADEVEQGRHIRQRFTAAY
jgi:putative NADH-flavin reductase